MSDVLHPALGAPARLARTLLLVDVAALLCAALAVVVVHRWHPVAALVLVGATLLCVRAGDLYGWRFGLSVLDDAPRLLLATAAGTAAAAVTGPWRPPHAGAEHLGAAAWALLALVAGRALGYALLRRGRHRGRHRARAVLVGRGTLAARVAAALGDHPEYGTELCGAVGPRHARAVPGPAEGLVAAGPAGAGGRALTHLGEACDLPAVLRATGASVVVVACEGEEPPGLGAALRACRAGGATVYAVAALAASSGLRPRGAEEVWGLMLVRQGGARAGRGATGAKRALDVVAATTALLVLWPVMLAVALAVRVESGPGVLFRQERVGRGGLPFTLYKFRSLRPASTHEQATTWDVTDDPRVGAVGSFIRRTSLDELPQLWNVLRGQMSLVGPRPERPHFVEHLAGSVPRYLERHRAPVGLTGWAQVHGLRGPTSVSDRVVLDNGYIDGWSLWTDVKILVRTVDHLLGGGPTPPAAAALPPAAQEVVGAPATIVLPPTAAAPPAAPVPLAVVVPTAPLVVEAPAPAADLASPGPR